ncbi:BON domain-containing protein [Hellea sp.]|nr:BON domain-containing protein [Hellea sp.]
MKSLTILSAAVLSLSLSACTTVTTAGVSKGDERNFARSVNDVSAERAIKARLKRAYGFEFKHVNVDVREGIVLLAGNVPRQEDRIEAERIAWSAPRIAQVGNELRIESNEGFVRGTKDKLLTTSVKTRLTADKYVKARNLNVETHNGVVYLLGVARNQAELERAAEIASTTKGAREVISYVTVAGIDSSISRLSQSANAGSPVQYAPAQAQPQYAAPQQRELPGFLTTTPTPSAPGIPLSQPMPHNSQIQGAPSQISDMGERLNKEFPTEEELGKYRTGAAGEAVSVIESEPYYIDPDTGKEIPVVFIDGEFVPKLIR